MDIKGIKSYFNSKKANEKTQEQELLIPQDRTQMDENQRTMLEKIRGKALAHYIAATIALGGGAAALQSCQEQNINIDLNNEEIKKLLTQMIQLQQQTNEYLKNLDSSNKELVQLVKDIYAQTAEIISILNQVNSGIMDINTALGQIQALIENSNSFDQEFLTKIDALINGQGDSNAKLDELIALNKEQNNWLMNIQKLIETLGESDKDLADMIQQWYNDYKNDMGEFKQNDQEHTTMMNLIYNAIKENGNISADILAKIDAIMNGGSADSAKLDEIIKLLGSIDSKLDILPEISEKLNTLIIQGEEKQNQTIDLLTQILQGVGSIDSKMDQMIKNQEESNKLLVQQLDKSDEIIAQLKLTNDKLFTLDELQEMLGPMYNQLVNEIRELGKNQITGDELTAIIEANKTDLTKTNGLIETLTTVVKNLNLNNGLTQEEKDRIIAALEGIRNDNAATHEDKMQAYLEILNELSGIKGSVDAFGETAKEISTKLDKFIQQADLFGNQMIDKMTEVINGQEASKAAMETYSDSFRQAVAQASQQRTEQIALLQAIVDKEGGNGGLTKAELEEVLDNYNMPDYSDILNDIYNRLGNVITGDDLQNYFIKTQPNLDKTNGLIETLTTVIKNKDFGSTGGSSIDTANMENLLGQILDSIKGLKAPTESQVNALITLVNQIAENTKPSQPTAYMHNQPVYDIDFYDAIDMIRNTAARDTYNA